MGGFSNCLELNLIEMVFQAKIGPKLKSLRYTNFTEFVDIDVVLSSCPNLETVGISAGL